MRNYKKQREEYRQLKKGYFHLSTDGWKDGKLFNSTNQFAYGMWLIGLATLLFPVVIYDFVLMPNHIHILLSGTGEAAVNVFLYLKRKINARLMQDGFAPLPEDYGFKLVPIEDKEQMRANFLYVDRNPYEKQLSAPGGYPWGCGYGVFSLLPDLIGGRKVESMTARNRKALTRSTVILPDNWEYHPVLGLLPKSFVDTRLFYKMFAAPKDYLTRLVKDYETFVGLARSLDENMVFDEKELEEIVSRELNGRPLSQLDAENKGRLAVTLYKKYECPPEMIAKTIRIPLHLVNQFLRAKDYR